jgi:hypothetical protein
LFLLLGLLVVLTILAGAALSLAMPGVDRAAIGAVGDGGPAPVAGMLKIVVATERHDFAADGDGPHILGKLPKTVDNDPAAVRARADTHDVTCSGTEPCGP